MRKQFEFEPRWFVVFIFFATGIFLGALSLFIWLFNGPGVFGLQKIHPPKSVYKYINPLLAIDIYEKKAFFENNILENRIQLLISKQQKGSIDQQAVYFRDIEAGRWVGVNDSQTFSPGNLLKIPIMIAYFKKAESTPTILDDKLVYHVDPTQSSTLLDGVSYSVDDLIEAMVTQDDGSAAEVLFDTIDQNALNDIYSDLSIPVENDKNTADFISVKQFSLLFRVLYNATYLGREYSEKALEILSRTPANDSFAGTLPNDLPVAHRFHTRTYTKERQSGFESHACGIVYYPQHPYILCMMGSGQDQKAINNFFQQVSQMVYTYTEETYKPITK